MTQTTLVPDLDHKRIATTQQRVMLLMSDGAYRTLREIAIMVGASEAGVSARLRECRRTCKCGYDAKHEKELAEHLALGMLFCARHTVERRRRGEPSSGLHEYRLT